MRLSTALLLPFAALVGAPAAMAADLPVAPEPVDYVRVCDAYGTGFFYIPGSDTCLRISGAIRAEYRFNDMGDHGNSWDDRSDNGTSSRARAYLYMDSRTNTEYGLLRTYMETYFTQDSGADEATTLNKAFVQFGNFTFGKTQSFWDFWTGYAFGANTYMYSDQKTWAAAYTAAFGNGLSGTLSVEDGTYRRTDLNASGTFASTSSTDTIGYAGHRFPDVVANLRMDQGWGSAQIMAAIHETRFAAAYDDSSLGWAIGGGVELNAPIMNYKDKVVLQAAYADGASSYVQNGWADGITDAVYNGGKVKNTRTWGVMGGLNHNWNSNWETNIEGGYATADASLGGQLDFNQWNANANVVWKPVAGLSIGAELEYQDVDYDSASSLQDKDSVSGLVRVQRKF